MGTKVEDGVSDEDKARAKSRVIGDVFREEPPTLVISAKREETITTRPPRRLYIIKASKTRSIFAFWQLNPVLVQVPSLSSKTYVSEILKSHPSSHLLNPSPCLPPR